MPLLLHRPGCQACRAREASKLGLPETCRRARLGGISGIPLVIDAGPGDQIVGSICWCGLVANRLHYGLIGYQGAGSARTASWYLLKIWKCWTSQSRMPVLPHRNNLHNVAR